MSKERERKIPIQVYLNENEKYVLDNKVKAADMRNISEYIRHINQKNLHTFIDTLI